MCGIAGFIGRRSIDDATIQACLALMHRRGPDHAASRHWINKAREHVYLLHSRLSIIDLDPRANQPFRIGSKWIVCNGELYNYLELRKELETAGYIFTTESDT